MIAIRCMFIYVVMMTFSCKESDREFTYYEDGQIKSIILSQNSKRRVVEDFDRLGNLVLKGYYDNGKIDSLFKYNKNKGYVFKRYFAGHATKSIEYDTHGNIEKSGNYINDTIKVGWWNFYKNNQLVAKRQYEIVCANYYLNQIILFDNNGDTLSSPNDDMETTFYSLTRQSIDNKFILSYDVKSLFLNNKLEMILLKNNYCSEEPDTIIELNSNKGQIHLPQKYFRQKGFFFDYLQEGKHGNQKRKIMHHKKYFDLASIEVK